jgi:LysM repeat protein
MPARSLTSTSFPSSSFASSGLPSSSFAPSSFPSTTVAPRRFTVVVPRAHAVTDVYRRRRLVIVGAVVFALALLLLGAGQVLANRGGDPASTPAVRPATAYIVAPGDTMWSLAARFHGSSPRSAYLDRLLADNGGSRLAVGQLVRLP